jgi:hypothetical protein
MLEHHRSRLPHGCWPRSTVGHASRRRNTTGNCHQAASLACMRANGHVCTAAPPTPFCLLTTYCSTVCMTLGRPSTPRIAEDVPIPLTLDEEYLPMVDTPPFRRPPAETFFVQNIKAARLLGTVLDQVYHPSFNVHSQSGPRASRLLTSDTLSAVLRLHSELEDLEGSSTDALRDSDDLDASARLILQRQRNVLSARSALICPMEIYVELTIAQTSSYAPHLASSLFYKLLCPDSRAEQAITTWRMRNYSGHTYARWTPDVHDTKLRARLR